MVDEKRCILIKLVICQRGRGLFIILKEYQREYKRMYGLHYNNSKKFTEAKFKKRSKEARELRSKYTDEQIEKFKTELKNLSKLYNC